MMVTEDNIHLVNSFIDCFGGKDVIIFGNLFKFLNSVRLRPCFDYLSIYYPLLQLYESNIYFDPRCNLQSTNLQLGKQGTKNDNWEVYNSRVNGFTNKSCKSREVAELCSTSRRSIINLSKLFLSILRDPGTSSGTCIERPA
jgi:hypothetical protein